MLRALKYVCWATLALWPGHYRQDVNNVSPTWELNSFHWESHVTFVIYLVVFFFFFLFVCVFFKNQEEVYTLCFAFMCINICRHKEEATVSKAFCKQNVFACVYVCERLFKIVPVQSFSMQI